MLLWDFIDCHGLVQHARGSADMYFELGVRIGDGDGGVGRESNGTTLTRLTKTTARKMRV